MATTVSVYSMGGLLLGSLSREEPIQVSELEALVRRPGSEFMLLLGDRELDSEDKLSGLDLEVSAVAGIDYAACPVESFEDLPLREELLHGIYGCSFQRPVHVQLTAIRPLLDGRSVVMDTPAGQGKTVAILIAVLQRLDLGVHAPQAIIVVPHRERAQAVQDLLQVLTRHLGATSCLLVGGLPVRELAEALRAGRQLVVGTAGRVLDMIERGVLTCDHVKMLMLDNAHDLFHMGFTPQVEELATKLLTTSPQLQMGVSGCLLSQGELGLFVKRFVKRPVKIVNMGDGLRIDDPNARHFHLAAEEADALITGCA